MDLMTLVARLTLDSSEYEQGVQKSQSLIGKAGSFIAGAAKAYIGVKAVGEIVKFGKQSIAVGRQFDVAMSQVAATMGDKSQETVEYMGKTMTAQEALRETAKKYGRETQFTATQSAEALNYMALAGYDANKSIAMLPNVLNLASAGSMDLARASDMVTDASSALGLSTEETTQLIDKMAMASTQGNTSVEQLGSAMLALGATGRNVAGGTTELAQAFTILADNGIKGSEGGTKLRNILLSIQGKKFDKTFGKLGISAYDASGNLRPMNDILLDMNKAMEGMTTQEKQNLINNTFNRGDLAAVNALLGTSTERWEELGVAIDNAGGAAETMAERQLNNLGGDMLKFQSAVEGLQIALSEKLTPALRFFTQFGTQASTMLTKVLNGDLTTAFKDTLPKGVTEAVSKVTKKFSSLVSYIKSVGTWFGNYFSEVWDKYGESITSFLSTLFEDAVNFISNGLTGLIGIIQSAVQGIYEFWKTYGDQIVSFLGTVIAKLIGIVSGFVSYITGALTIFFETVMSIIEPLLAWILDIWNRYGEDIVSFVAEKVSAILDIVRTYITFVDTFLTNILTAIKSVVQNVLTGIQSFWDTWGSTILAVTDATWQGIKTTISTVIEVIKNVIQLAMNIITGNWKGAWNNVKNIFSSIWSGIKSLISIKLNEIKTVFSNILGVISNAVSTKFEAIRSKIKEKIDAAKEAVSNAINKIKSFFNFSWSLPKLKMPHISISGSFSLVPPSAPKFGISWYKKAYDNIVEFANPTVIPTLSGLKGFGDGAGSELVMSKNAFFDAIESARGDTQIVFNIYPQKGQSEEEIARAVEKKFIQWNNQKKGAFV